METTVYMAHAIKDFGTARQALVRSMVGVALGYLNAQGWDADDPNKVERELFKQATKKAMRDGGNDRKTADRHVNTACTLAAKMLTQLDLTIRHDQTERQMIDNVFGNLWSRGGKSIAAVKRLLDTGSAVELEKDKTPEEKAKEVADAARAEEKATADLLERAMAVDLDAEPEPVAEPASEDPVSQIETFDPEALIEGLTPEQMVVLAGVLEKRMAAVAHKAQPMAKVG